MSPLKAASLRPKIKWAHFHAKHSKAPGNSNEAEEGAGEKMGQAAQCPKEGPLLPGVSANPAGEN